MGRGVLRFRGCDSAYRVEFNQPERQFCRARGSAGLASATLASKRHHGRVSGMCLGARALLENGTESHVATGDLPVPASVGARDCYAVEVGLTSRFIEGRASCTAFDASAGGRRKTRPLVICTERTTIKSWLFCASRAKGTVPLRPALRSTGRPARAGRQISMESLILAQDERWRRA